MTKQRVEKIAASAKVENRVFDLMEIKEPCGTKHFWFVEPGKGNNRLTQKEFELGVEMFQNGNAEKFARQMWAF